MIENENQKGLSFLDVEIICEDRQFITSIYDKPIFSGIYTDIESTLSSAYKFVMVHKLTHNFFQISSVGTELHAELLFLKQIFFKSGFPENFKMVQQIHGFLKHAFTEITLAFKKKPLALVFLYLYPIS